MTFARINVVRQHHLRLAIYLMIVVSCINLESVIYIHVKIDSIVKFYLTEAHRCVIGCARCYMSTLVPLDISHRHPSKLICIAKNTVINVALVRDVSREDMLKK
jgi:hypothetical protein